MALEPLTLTDFTALALACTAQLRDRHGLVELGDRAEHLADQLGRRRVVDERAGIVGRDKVDVSFAQLGMTDHQIASEATGRLDDDRPRTSITVSNNNTNSGWLVGAGIEWAFAPNWSVKIEYDYLGLNSQTFTAPAGGFLAGDTFTTSNPNVQVVKVGANYLFKYGVGGY